MILTFCVLNENFHSIGIIYFITNSTHLKIVRICPVFELEKSLMVLIYTFSEPLTWSMSAPKHHFEHIVYRDLFRYQQSVAGP